MKLVAMHELRSMRDDQDRIAVAQPEEQLLDGAGSLDIESRARFIHEDDPGLER